MSQFLISFFTSLIATFLIVKYQDKHSHISGDNDFSGPQKNHSDIIPRIGGVSIALGVLLATTTTFENLITDNINIIFIISMLPTFAIGLAEDCTKNIGIRTRLILTIQSALFLIFLADVKILSLGIAPLDFILTNPLVGLIFTTFAITGLTNAYNIIDGFNGLASLVGIVTLSALAYVAYQLNDPIIINLCICMVGAVLGFFFWNFPKGLIFMGDGGAYLIGFWIAGISILIINRHQELSPWFAILVNGYPILETIYTIYRRKIYNKKNVAQPDAMHLHSLIFQIVSKKYKSYNGWLTANSITSIFVWIFAFGSIFSALIFRESSSALATLCIVYCFVYIYIYKKLID
jgi:UDP-N-acetylmuramyl pentapeptide phosphotransferase/UDP-N-acetylglucosamine-1-phosphate transferase